MYTEFYHLRSRPFTAFPDPSSIWLGPKQMEALAALRHDLLERGGLVLLTGMSGSGKSTLVGALTRGFAAEVMWAAVGDPGFDRLDFYNAIARGFGLSREFTSKVQFLLQFNAFLQKAHDERKKVVLLIDDCQQLSQEMLEELPLLASIGKEEERLLNILLVGRPEVLTTLMQPSNRAVRQRLSGEHEMVALSRSETADYIGHRMRVAGTEEEIFTARAIDLVHHAAGGNPRLVNMICEQALQTGFATENRQIGRTVVEDSLVQLKLTPAPGREGSGPDEKAPRQLPPQVANLSAWLGRLTVAARQVWAANRARRWATCAMGVVLVGGAALLLSVPDRGQKAPAGQPPAQQPAANREKPREAAPSRPGKLEPIGKAIDLNLGGDRQTIVKKETGGQDGGPATPAPEAKKSELPASPQEEEKTDSPAAPAPEAVTPAQPGEQPAARTEAEADRAPIPPPPAQTSPKVAAPAVPEEKVEKPVTPATEAKSAKAGEHAPKKEAMQPRKVVLPLRASSLELTEEGEKDFREFIERLKGHPKAKLLVKGFVSARSNSPENIKLSEARAMAVQKLLVKSGIDPRRITVKGMGNLEPIAPNASSEGRTKNRRVEVEVVGDGR